jgi:hypothetical protein
VAGTRWCKGRALWTQFPLSAHTCIGMEEVKSMLQCKSSRVPWSTRAGASHRSATIRHDVCRAPATIR